MSADSSSPEPPRGPAARRRLVREQVLQEGFARVEDLAGRFDVSSMTMHRDLDALQTEGWLIKIRGGATANPAALVETDVRGRMTSMRREKAAIAGEAATLVRPGHSVLLDDSSTVLAMTDHLLTRSPSMMATNFLPALAALREATCELVLLGGEFRSRQESCQGLGTIAAVERLRFDLFFSSATAVEGQHALFRSEQTVLTRQAFMNSSSHNVLLLDHAKFGRPAPHVLCKLDAFDTVIVDDGIHPDDLALLRDTCDDVRTAHT